MVALRDGQAVKCGRVSSSWLGLAPHQYITSGKPIHFGNQQAWKPYYLGTMLVHGAHAVLTNAQAKKKSDPYSCRVREVTKHNCQHKAILAIADKMTRIGWAVLAKDLHYDPQLL